MRINCKPRFNNSKEEYKNQFTSDICTSLVDDDIASTSLLLIPYLKLFKQKFGTNVINELNQHGVFRLKKMPEWQKYWDKKCMKRRLG